VTTDYSGAADQINGAAFAAWKLATFAVVGSVQKMFFQGVVKQGVAEVGAADEYWARVALQTVNQGSIGPGSRRHCAVGLVFVQMFFPLSKPDAWPKGKQIATRVKNALSVRSSAGTVWFRNPRINELAPDGDHHRLNVVAEFEYDETV
jgi:hypothetical protein